MKNYRVMVHASFITTLLLGLLMCCKPSNGQLSNTSAVSTENTTSATQTENSQHTQDVSYNVCQTGGGQGSWCNYRCGNAGNRCSYDAANKQQPCLIAGHVTGTSCANDGYSDNVPASSASDVSAGTAQPATSTVTTNTSGDLTFNVIDATTGAIRTVITNNSTISAGNTSGSITILVVGPANLKSVRFNLDGAVNYRTVNGAPFTASGSGNPPYQPLTLRAGTHILTANAYDGTDASGMLVLSQTVIFTLTSS